TNVLRTYRLRQNREWLCRARLLTRDSTLRHWPFLDREKRFPGFAVQNKDVAHFRADSNRRNVAAIALHRNQRRLCSDIIVPYIMMHYLKMPYHLTRRSIKRNH